MNMEHRTKNRKHMSSNIARRVSLFAVCSLFIALCSMNPVSADEASELRNKIKNTQSQIEAINRDIAKFEQELQKVGAEKSTLQAALDELNLTRRKLLADISLTQKEIEKTTYTIRELENEISESERRINRNSAILAQALREIRIADESSFVETILATESISNLWFEIDQLEQIQRTVRQQLLELRDTKSMLEGQHANERTERDNLTAFKNNLAGQQKVIEDNANQKNKLLDVTKNKEAEYQALLAQKQAARKQFEGDLQAYESQLTYILDPSRLPKEGSGVLIWPLASPLITQGFGLTDFARSGAYGYDAQGRPNPHRGLDFRASVGTPLLAAAGGTVRDAFDMDKISGCYSYGKWILIDHDNGLSTLYAHLSAMNVSAGESVKVGQIIGYAGQSGFATGPHLHFTVFDRDAVKVDYFAWSNGCKGAKIAYAPYEAYLNPLSYLPK